MYLVPARGRDRDRYVNLHRMIKGDLCHGKKDGDIEDVLSLLMESGVEVAFIGADARRIARHLDRLVVDEEPPAETEGEAVPSSPDQPEASTGRVFPVAPSADRGNDDRGVGKEQG